MQEHYLLQGVTIGLKNIHGKLHYVRKLFWTFKHIIIAY